MTILMDKLLFDRIVNQLVPEMGSIASRQALIQSALFGSPVVNQIDWSGTAHEFTVQLVTRLYKYDVSAITAVLHELHTQVGSLRQAEIKDLIGALATIQSTPKGQTLMIEPGILVGFLMEIGRWAKSELSERWKLRREQQSADLTNRQEVEQTVPEMLQAAATANSPQRVGETINLIERKRDAIDRARNAKLTHREERERGEITENMFILRVKKEDETIRQMLNEIESDLNDLGFDVEREPA